MKNLKGLEFVGIGLGLLGTIVSGIVADKKMKEEVRKQIEQQKDND